MELLVTRGAVEHCASGWNEMGTIIDHSVVKIIG